MNNARVNLKPQVVNHKTGVTCVPESLVGGEPSWGIAQYGTSIVEFAWGKCKLSVCHITELLGLLQHEPNIRSLIIIITHIINPKEIERRRK